MSSASAVDGALRHPLAWPVSLVLLALPALALTAGAMLDRLGANPAEYLIRATGDWTLRLLCLSLALTPLRVSLGWHALARLRRRVGVAVYVYASLHLASYAAFDMGFDGGEVVRDIVKRPFILMGFLGWLWLTPMALTSFNRAVRLLGARRWNLLHRLVYGVAVVAVIHFAWMRAGKNDFAEPVLYGTLLALLLAWRAWRAWSGGTARR